MRTVRLLVGLMVGICTVAVGMAPCSAQTAPAVPSVQAVETTIGSNSVRYPQLTGMADQAMQEQINNAIVEKGKVAQRMLTLATLQAGGTGLKVDFSAFLENNIFSTVINAVGVMENGRNGQAYAALTIDLTTGKPVTLDALFTDAAQTVAWMEETLAATYLDELGSYAVNSELTPLPADHFSMDAQGITFYYPESQFSMASGYCGAAQFTFSELRDWLLPEPDGIPARLHLLAEPLSDVQIRAAVLHMASQGALPGIPVNLADAMPDVIAQYRLLREPDQFPGGRYCQMEAPMFRQTLVLTDALAAGYDHSVVTGIMSYRADLFGIKVGATTQARWREILGMPDDSVVFDDALAYSYAWPAGTADYYQLDGALLLLYADADGVLFAVRLTTS